MLLLMCFEFVQKLVAYINARHRQNTRPTSKRVLLKLFLVMNPTLITLPPLKND